MRMIARSHDGGERRTVVRLALLATVLALLATLSATTRDARAQSDTTPVATESGGVALPASKFVPIIPTRVLDTRPEFGPTRGMARLANNNALSVDPINGPAPTGGANVATQLTNLGVNPATATAVVVNITYVDSGGPGFTSVWPTGLAQPTASTNNADVAGQTKPNLVIAPLGVDNKISVYSLAESDYLVDVMGVMVETTGSPDGRFISLGPIRHSDSRFPDRHVSRQTRYRADEVRSVDLKPAGVPADASAVVLNVTSDRSAAPGFIRIWPDGDPQPGHSNVNMAVAGEATSNQVISGVNNGVIQVFTLSATDLIIDVAGYFTGPNGASSTDGLFVPITPGRLLDTRETTGPTAFTGGEKVPRGGTQRLPVVGRLDIPASGVKAAAFNVTAVLPEAAGFVTAYPSAGTLPPTSSVNYNRPGVVVPNHAITSLSSGGQIDLFTLATSHLVVDVSGYFLDATGTLPTGGRQLPTIRESTFVPTRRDGSTRPASAPYDFLFDRGEFRATGVRPSPTRQVRWNACGGPLRYAVNIDGATDTQIEALIVAVEQVEAGIGVDLQFGGVTSAGLDISNRVLLADAFGLPFKYLPPDDDGTGPVDFVVGFSNDQRTPEFAGGVIGIGGSARTEYDALGRAFAQRGFALTDLAQLGDGSPLASRRITATTTHELGHMFGLGHVDEIPPTGRQGLEAPGTWAVATLQAQLMYPFLLPTSPSDFAGGDVLGLWELYNTNAQNCGGALRVDESEPLVEVGKMYDVEHPDGDHAHRIALEHVHDGDRTPQVHDDHDHD